MLILPLRKLNSVNSPGAQIGMAQKCIHKGCGKAFTDFEEDCNFHPGPPVFHEGQKVGKHSIIDETPRAEPSATEVPADLPSPPKPISTNGFAHGESHPKVNHASAPIVPSHAPPESESDDASLPLPPNITCRRRGCNVTSPTESRPSREDEECIHHPGQALFHEGTKGWTCCKRRVLEFDEFMKIEGCKIKKKHLFLGSRKNSGEEEMISEVRNDFYQTPTSVIASLFLKRIDKERARVEFSSETTVSLDLPTGENKRYSRDLSLYGHIKPSESKYKIMGTKLELTLVKVDGLTWPTLRSDEQRTSEILQVGRAGKA
ncbi:hypothetical protein ACLMJK_004162 [Lecanora helva]